MNRLFTTTYCWNEDDTVCYNDLESYSWKEHFSKVEKYERDPKYTLIKELKVIKLTGRKCIKLMKYLKSSRKYIYGKRY